MTVGRYVIFGEIASGGMASVHFGLLSGPVGFRRTVAIKRLHANYARDPAFVTQFLDEARLAGRIRHPNVVQTLDVVAEGQELLLVMEYVEGETLARLGELLRAENRDFPIEMAAGIVAGALHGLNAAHDATDEQGMPLELVHRDVSPQNIIVGRDGVPRVLDFGVAKAAARIHTTQGELVKGKLKYMAPEQVSARPLDRRTDVFAAGIVLWEALAQRPLFEADAGPAAIIHQVVTAPIGPPSEIRPDIPPQLDAIVMKALSRRPEQRYQSAGEFAEALETTLRLPSANHVGRWVHEVAGEGLDEQARMRIAIERRSAEPSLTDTGIRLIETARTADLVPAERAEAQTVAEVIPLKGAQEGASDSDGGLPSCDREPAQPPGRPRRVLLLAGLVLLLGVFASWAAYRLPGPETVGKGSTSGDEGQRHASGPTPESQQGETPSARPLTLASPSTSASAGQARVGGRRGSRPATRPKQKCASPTYLDPEGIRRFRPECL